MLRISWMVLCLIFIGCFDSGRSGKKWGQKEFPVSIKASRMSTLSDCIIRLEAVADDLLVENEDFSYRWLVGGEPVEDTGSGIFNFTGTVNEKRIFEVAVIIESKKYYGTASVLLEVVSYEFKNPLESNFSFSGEPVINRDVDQFIDPGAIVYHDGKFHSFYNAIFRDGIIYGGYAISVDGLNWTKLSSHEKPVFKREDVQEVSGHLPRGIHMSSALYYKGKWIVYFAAVETPDFFYGGIYRGESIEPLGPWSISPGYVMKGESGAWNENIGLAQVFKTDSDEYLMYYVSEEGDVGIAVSSGSITWKNTPGPVANALRPCIVKTETGWIMLSENNLYLSPDGKDWHLYKEKLYSQKDRQDRDLEIIWISTAVIHENRIYYYIEGGSMSAGSNVYLISWDI